MIQYRDRARRRCARTCRASWRAPAMEQILAGEATPAQIGGARGRAAHEGRDPRGDRRHGRGDARSACRRSAPGARRCSTPAAPAATTPARSTSRPPSAHRHRLVRRGGRQARQPRGLEPHRQRRRARVARRAHRPDARERRRARSTCSASRSCSRPTTTPRCATPPGRAARSACAPCSTCSARSPTRPARTRQLLGVYSDTLVRPIAEVLQQLGSERAWVVHGRDGLDELTVFDKIARRRARRTARSASSRSTRPSSASRHTDRAGVAGGDAADNAAAHPRGARRARRAPARDIVVLNTGAALVVAGVAPRPRARASRGPPDAIDSGARARAHELAD